MEFSECFKFVSEEVVKAFPEEGMWVPFSDPNVGEIPEVAREHTILAMLGVTSRTPRTRELKSAYDMVSAWRGLTPIEVEVGVFKKVKFIGFGCSTTPKDYYTNVAKRVTFNRAYEKATRLIFDRLQNAQNSDDSNVTINTPLTIPRRKRRKSHPRAAKVVTPCPSRKRQNDGMLKTPRKKEKKELLNEASKLLAESNRGGVSPKTVNRNVQLIANIIRSIQIGEAERAALVAALQEEFLPRNNNNNNNNNKNKVEVPSADFVSQRTHLRSVP